MSESLETLERMNEAELRDLIQRAQTALRERSDKRIEELRQLAREAGYEVTLTRIGEDRFKQTRRSSTGKRLGDDRRREVSAKYQNPDNPKEQWSGRGRKPKWVEVALAHSSKLEDLTISAGG